MGNCIILESKDQWGGEDWSPAFDHKKHDDDIGDEFEASILKPEIRIEVKLKITKKQLQELAGKTELQGLSVEEALKKMMKMSSEFKIQEITSWRPRLQSIPEANSFHFHC